MANLFGDPYEIILNNVQELSLSKDRGEIHRSSFIISAVSSGSWQLVYDYPINQNIKIHNLFLNFEDVMQDIAQVNIDYKVTMENQGEETLIGTTEADNTLIFGSMLYVIDVFNYNGLFPSGNLKVYVKTSSPLGSDRQISIINLFEILGGAI